MFKQPEIKREVEAVKKAEAQLENAEARLDLDLAKYRLQPNASFPNARNLDLNLAGTSYLTGQQLPASVARQVRNAERAADVPRDKYGFALRGGRMQGGQMRGRMMRR
jgi:hypothetical protein